MLDEIIPAAAEAHEKISDARKIFNTVENRQKNIKKGVKNFKTALAKVVSKQETVEEFVEELSQRLQVVQLGLEGYRANPLVEPVQINGTVYSYETPIGSFFVQL